MQFVSEAGYRYPLNYLNKRYCEHDVFFKPCEWPLFDTARIVEGYDPDCEADDE